MIGDIQILRDTVAVISNEKVAAFYADMIDKQQGQFNILLVAIGLIVAAVIGSTWWWNYKGSKAQISEEIQTGLKKFQRLFNSHKASMEKQVDDEIEKRVREQVDILSSQMKKDLDEYKEKIIKDNKNMSANLCRVFALHCSAGKMFFNSATWWLSAFNSYVELEDGEFEQISIDAFVEALKNCFKDEVISEEQLESLGNMKESLDKIPNVFSNQRRDAKKLLKQITDKTRQGREEK